jgi:peptidoglycan/xylan/chitin deacetylase (PgdA/CDA1 family)
MGLGPKRDTNRTVRRGSAIRRRWYLRCLVAAALVVAGWRAPASAQPEEPAESAAVQKKKKRWPKPAGGQSQSGGPEVVFTFDDGPHEVFTRRILDALARHHVQAIFYWVGWRVTHDRSVERVRKELVARAVREGHLIGNHTVNHVHLCRTPYPEAEKEIDGNRDLLEAAARIPVVLFRVPYGARCKNVERLLADRGLQHLHWDIDPQEWVGLNKADTAAHVIDQLKRLEGRAVLLMHDTRGVSARALPIILDWIEVENRRRRASGERPIRIVSGSELVEEQHASELWSWGLDSVRSAEARLGRALGGLVPGRASPAAVAQHGAADRSQTP